MTINPKVLHDAFFKHQTKPQLTRHGDLYYEGKEFEVTLREKAPGTLTAKLKEALAIPDGAPPPTPWPSAPSAATCANTSP